MSSVGVFFILFVATFLKNGLCDDNSDAYLLALTTSKQLEPPTNLILKFAKELKAIRCSYPAVANIYYYPPWVPGQVLAQLSDEQLDQIRKKYGEVTVELLFDKYKLLTFAKQYNSEVLADELTEKQLAESAEPNFIVGRSSNIEYDCRTRIYKFSVGWGDCQAGCIDKHYWEFIVLPGCRVYLLREYGSLLPTSADE